MAAPPSPATIPTRTWVGQRGRVGHEDHVTQQGDGSTEPDGMTVEGDDDGKFDIE